MSRFLISGLTNTGKYSFRCLGGAKKHNDYRNIKINDDFIIKPVDGFGTQEMIRNFLYTERPDAILIFTDPRQFIWLYEMEDEIHQVCPITYWHVWDNDPYPDFNKPFYDATDLINCLSRKTYDLVKPNYPEKTNYIPHALPKDVYYPLPQDQIDKLKKENFADKSDWFKVLWVNRNARRKMPADLLNCWKLFLEEMEKKYGHKKAMLIMHTDPNDEEGPALLSVAERLGLQEHVFFSTEQLEFEHMNILHNICDCSVNIAINEGFGILNLASLQVGKPIVALKTGGETSKAIDERDGSENGVAIDPCKRALVGSQLVPYIFEDYAATEDVVNGFLKLYDMKPSEWNQLSKKCMDYAHYAFSYEKMIQDWDQTLTETIENWQDNKPKQWSFLPLTVEAQSESQQQQKQENNQQNANQLNDFLKNQVQSETQLKRRPQGKKKVASSRDENVNSTTVKETKNKNKQKRKQQKKKKRK